MRARHRHEGMERGRAGQRDVHTSLTCCRYFSKYTGVHPRFFDEQLGPAVGAIDCVKGCGNKLGTSIPLKFVELTFVKSGGVHRAAAAGAGSPVTTKHAAKGVGVGQLKKY